MAGINIPNGNQKQFFGQKVSKAGKNVYNASDNDLIYKNDYSTQTYYSNNGTAMEIGKLASGGYGISVPANTGTINFGDLADGNLGMNTVDANGNVLFEMVGATWYWYDASGNNVMQVGLLPDGTYGWAVATPGNSVSGAY